MALMRFANAVVVPDFGLTPEQGMNRWRQRTASRRDGHVSNNLLEQASGIFERPFNPKDYLLTHATIVASVDVYEPPGTKKGSILDNGFRVNRKYGNYRIQDTCDKYINNNLDAWSRPVLLKSYRTFIGAHNFVEHVQIEDLSKGRIIDAAARDIGESIYVDILIATERKHRDLISSLESGKMSTLSMGCFLPGTQVTMADGRRIAIEDVQPGDMVLTHKGRIREVLNKQIKGGKWGIRRIQAVGIPNTIEATDNHPFFVFRQPDTCACGCGDALPGYKNGRKNATRGLKRRFKTGHDKRILNPNGTYSMKEYQERTARLDAIKTDEGQWVRADELRVGDFVCFPRQQAEGAVEISEGKARLLGYFLAEGSFLKSNGRRVSTQFTFGLGEKDTFVAEVVGLLQQEFTLANVPWTHDREDRNTCTVTVTDERVAEWFFAHGGEYSHGKRMASEVLAWSVEAQKHLIGAWINGDGHLNSIHGHTSGTTSSYDLACQMHMLMARCGWFARLEAKRGAQVAFNVKRVVVAGAECIQSDVALYTSDSEWKHPHFNLIVGKTQAVSMAPYTDKAATEAAFASQGSRVRDDVVMFPITSIEGVTYEGWVHNMEVDEDHSYVVEGVGVRNCTVDGTQCTKCGHWAADETEMCQHVRYEKGNIFYDAGGQKHRVAELCGHESLDPTGGVQFIEGSWVGTPAFTGAVMRNILEPTGMVSRMAQEILSKPPKKWDAKSRQKAAFDMGSPLVAQWDDGGGDDAGGDAGGDDAAAPAKPEPSGLKKIEDDLTTYMLDRVQKRLQKEMSKEDVAKALTPENSSAAPNSTLIKQGGGQRVYQASLTTLLQVSASDAQLLNGVAALNQSLGIEVPVQVYRAMLKTGGAHRYATMQEFLRACQQALGRQPNLSEAKTMIRLGKLISQHEVESRRGESNPGSIQGEDL